MACVGGAIFCEYFPDISSSRPRRVSGDDAGACAFVTGPDPI
jgi:hypothetical protein